MTDRPQAMRDALLRRICEAMADDPKLFFVCADFGSPVLDSIREHFPERFINVGIAEQNLINVSAGLALEGYTVFAYAIAPFITMRCYEQIRVSLALLSQVRQLNVNLIGVGAGYSYVVSGPTHQCYEDLTLMRAMPNMAVYSPADHITAAALFDRCLALGGPKYLRLDAQVLPVLYANAPPDMATGFQRLRDGQKLCLVATGYMVHTALKVAER
jgi:transketolase